MTITINHADREYTFVPKDDRETKFLGREIKKVVDRGFAHLGPDSVIALARKNLNSIAPRTERESLLMDGAISHMRANGFTCASHQDLTSVARLFLDIPQREAGVPCKPPIKDEGTTIVMLRGERAIRVNYGHDEYTFIPRNEREELLLEREIINMVDRGFGYLGHNAVIEAARRRLDALQSHSILASELQSSFRAPHSTEAQELIDTYLRGVSPTEPEASSEGSGEEVSDPVVISRSPTPTSGEATPLPTPVAEPEPTTFAGVRVEEVEDSIELALPAPVHTEAVEARLAIQPREGEVVYKVVTAPCAARTGVVENADDNIHGLDFVAMLRTSDIAARIFEHSETDEAPSEAESRALEAVEHTMKAYRKGCHVLSRVQQVALAIVILGVPEEKQQEAIDRALTRS